MAHYFVLFLLLGAVAASAALLPSTYGFVFAGEAWAHPMSNYSSARARESLRALYATGARHVRVLVFAYVDSPVSTSVHGVPPPSPLATTAAPDLAAFLNYTCALGLSVTLSPILDLNWAVPANFNNFAWYDTGAVSRAEIGASFSPVEWDAFFGSYTAWLVQLASVVAAPLAPPHAGDCFSVGSVGTLSVGDGHTALFGQGARMRALIDAVRGVYGGCVTAAATGDDIRSIDWWDAVDVISHTAFWPLAAAPSPIGAPPSAAAMTAAWAPVTSMLSAVSAAAGGKRIVMSAVGAQSRPNCALQPWGTGSPGSDSGNDQPDDSAWPVAYDMVCQAQLYESVISAFSPYASTWWAGVHFYRWSPDPSAGGTSDADFTPHGKAAEAVFANWTGACTGGPAACTGDASVIATLIADAADFVAEGKSRRGGDGGGRAGERTPFAGYRGFVFGGPDEWSSPYYRLGSQGARTSLENLKSIGGNAVEVVVQWYFKNVTSHSAYPIVDMTNPMATSTDAELRDFIGFAQSLGMRVVLSPMLDPDWTLPSQFGCRVTNGQSDWCYWRGQIGWFWSKEPLECTNASDWGLWHSNYSAFILHYAALAEAAHVDTFLIAHELTLPTQLCANNWGRLLAAVRRVFSGQVSAAMLPDIFNVPATEAVWLKQLDWVGLDCYLGPTATTSGLLPWQDAPYDDIVAGVRGHAADVANLSSTLDRQIGCTEVGWAAWPWAGETGWGQNFDVSSGSVFALTTWGPAQALIYEAFLTVYEGSPWYAGGFYWLWRADPTAGGMSDNSPVPWAKETTAAIALIWE